MKSTLVMNFKTENGKITPISITEPKADLTEAEVKAAANEIAVKKAFLVGQIDQSAPLALRLIKFPCNQGFLYNIHVVKPVEWRNCL